MTALDIGSITGDEAKSILEGLVEDGTLTKEIFDQKLATIKRHTQGAALEAITVDEAPAGDEVTLEADPRLQSYAAHYDRWPEAMRTQYPWKIVRGRLLTDTAEGGAPLLTAAKGLIEAVFFGMDAKGNPMFADGKQNPRDLYHFGLDYRTTRQRVCFKEGKDGKKVPTGYAMFPFANNYDKGEEMLAFERFTKNPFVSSEDNQRVASWGESGENPSWPGEVNFYPHGRYARVNGVSPRSNNPKRGVRRLLRGQKAKKA